MNNCFLKKNIYLVFGTGLTGTAIITFLIKQRRKFYVTDDNKEKLKNIIINKKRLNEKYKLYHIDGDVIKEKKINFLVLSPSVHAQKEPHSIVVLCKKFNINIIADIDLFYDYILYYNRKNNTKKRIIAITGTNGKSTTTALTAFLFEKIKKKAVACGNIGLNVFSVEVNKYDYFVVEMSSYNLFLSHYAHFYSGVLLNITEDHLSYHGTFKNYINAKAKALSLSKIKIACIDNGYIKNIVNNFKKKSKVSSNVILVSRKQILKNGFSWLDGVYYYNGSHILTYNFKNLPGVHNIENILCSVACVIKVSKISNKKDICNVFKNVSFFKGLPHRIQFIKKINNVLFFNDSKATNADSTKVALETFSKNDIYLIAGGQRKTAGFFSLKDDLKNVKCVFLIGEATDSFSNELIKLNIKYNKCYNMKKAVLNAFLEAKKSNNKENSIVLLSPLCASWDQYKNFEDRGNDFIKIVSSI